MSKDLVKTIYIHTKIGSEEQDQALMAKVDAAIEKLLIENPGLDVEQEWDIIGGES